MALREAKAYMSRRPGRGMELEKLLEELLDEKLYQIVLSNAKHPDKVSKVKIRPVMLQNKLYFQRTSYVGTQVFHENLDKQSAINQVIAHLERDFKQMALENMTANVTALVSKKGKMTIKRTDKKLQNSAMDKPVLTHNRKKSYLLEEGVPVPFLMDLGVQTKEGKIVHAKYDKFRQINRFLEIIDDILPALSKERTVRILDFGCGKSYLTFAAYYYLHEIKGYDLQVTGLDLKEDVIEKCNRLKEKYGYAGLQFEKGNIKDYTGVDQVDMVITLHACDTATDYALEKAVKWGAEVILSVPCCQHELNQQIQCDALEPVLKYGIIKERMSALITDALRAEKLTACGYETQILEFIDMEHTPKNLMIRGIKKQIGKEDKEKKEKQLLEIDAFLNIHPTLQKLI